MPASMIRAAVGGRWKVMGSNIAIVATGPMPGSTPISVPTMQPTNAYHRFWRFSATVRPRLRLCSRSISATSKQSGHRLDKLRDPVEHRIDSGPNGLQDYGSDIAASDVEDGDIHSQTDPEDDERQNCQDNDVGDDLADLELIAAQRGDQDEDDQGREHAGPFEQQAEADDADGHHGDRL